MSISCDPGSLVDAAKCLDCLTDHQQLAIQTYLLSVKAGVSPDPGALMDSSNCLGCLSDKQLRNAIAYLLCQINNGGGGSCAALSGVSAPTGSVTPQFVGQLYNQDGGAAFFYSTGLTSADWTEITGGVGATEIVAGSLINNPGIRLSSDVLSCNSLTKLDLSALTSAAGGVAVGPTTALTTVDLSALTSADGGVDIGANPALTTVDLSALTSAAGTIDFDTNPALTTLDLSALTSADGGVILNSNTALTTVDLSALTSAAGGVTVNSAALTTLDLSALTSAAGGVAVSSNTALTTVDLSALTSADGGVGIEANTALTTLDLSALTSAAGLTVNSAALTTLDLSALTSSPGGVSIESNAALTSVLVPNFLPTDGTSVLLDGNALDDTSVNLVLARCVAAGVTTCTIDLSGGTNSAPTGQGITDAAALVVAGNTVTTN